MRSALVVIEMAVALVALAGAGLFIRSLSVARQVDLGFDGSRLVIANLNPPTVGFTAEQARLYFEAVEERLRTLPGVEQAAVAQFQALGGGQVRSTYPEGQTVAAGQSVFPCPGVVSRRPSGADALVTGVVRERQWADAWAAFTMSGETPV